MHFVGSLIKRRFTRWIYWRPMFKSFLNFHKEDFNKVSIKILDAELDIWKELRIRNKKLSTQ